MKKKRKKRRPGMSKGKGGGFERVICKKLSLWMSHGKQEDLFWRAAMSGGRSTIARKKGKFLSASAGDISAIDPLGSILTEHFFIECKAHEDLYLHRFVTEHSGKLAGFWEKVCKQAFDHRRKPMIICKQNFYPELMLVSDSLKSFVQTKARARCIVQLQVHPSIRLKCFIYLLSDVLEHKFKLVK